MPPLAGFVQAQECLQLRLGQVVAAFKAYTTRVGEGPFPTEFEKAWMNVSAAKAMNLARPPAVPGAADGLTRCLARYAVTINGATQLAIMKLDVLDELEEIEIATAYKYKGKIYKDYSHDLDVLAHAKPVYEKWPGWKSSTRQVRQYNKLPLAARRYIERLEELLEVPIKYISVGSKRDEIIIR